MLLLVNTFHYLTYFLSKKKKKTPRVEGLTEMETEVVLGYRQDTVMGSSNLSFSVLPYQYLKGSFFQGKQFSLCPG